MLQESLSIILPSYHTDHDVCHVDDRYIFLAQKNTTILVARINAENLQAKKIVKVS